MNQPSLLRFQEAVTDGGLLIVNSSLARMEDVTRNGIQVHEVPMNELAIELGNTRLTNMVALGAYAQLSGAIDPGELGEALQAVIPARNKKFIPLNEKAILEGAAFAARG
jgi:2-oxoglutarate ferredoxin oxidoreductase subunit gamma